MFSAIIKNDRFSLVVLALAGTAGLLWYLRPQLGWLPLLIALIPWMLRTSVGLSPFQPSPLDLPMALFMATAAGGLWLAYNQPSAQAKYWLIIGAVLIFYALVVQPRQNLWLLTALLTLFGVGVAVYFLLTHDWQTQPAKAELFNQIGLWIMSIRPTIEIDNIHPNVAGGLVAVTTPFPIAIGLRGLRSEHRWPRKLLIVLFAVFSSLFLLFVLLITTSRGALLALGAALFIWLAWEASSTAVRHRDIDPRLIFGMTFVSLGVIGLFILLTYPGGLAALVNQLPGPSSVDSRAELVRDTLYLIGDFPLFGAGLGSFPGLYSHYILILPTFILGHSHNLLLDVALEQGPLGLLSMIGVIGGSLLLLLRYESGERRIRHLSLLRWAVTSSLLVLLLHGLIDDPLYGSRAVLFLFLMPGLAVAIARPHSRENGEIPQKKLGKTTRLSRRTITAAAAVIVISFALVAILYRNVLLSAWYSNLGAVEMARVELANWPTDQWDDGRNVASLEPAEGLFNQALTLNPTNVTAHYRLGLIAMLRRDYQSAVGHLDAASLIGPNNQGIQKSLGYSYAWSGEFDHALANLQTISEARQEMSVYVYWWDIQGRHDLSEYAAIMEAQLISSSTLPAD